MSKNILVTGGAGFIGSAFCRLMIEKSDSNIINLDALTYAGNLENLRDIEESPKYRFVKGYIQDENLVPEILKEYDIDIIVNFAAESHVDRSILDSSPFIDTNVKGTLNLLNAAKERGVELFLQISTDEAYGSLGADGKFTEESILKPNSPYSASKTAADMLAYAYYKTHGTPIIITRCSNNYGPYQFPEKLIPLVISNALENKAIPVYGDGKNVRDWIYVDDHCDAVKLIMEKGRIGEVYNIGGECEKSNIDVVKGLLDLLNKEHVLIQFVKDRPGHDRRYAMDITKIRKELGWSPKVSFEEGLSRTIQWYLANEEWRRNILSGGYMEYYDKQYGNRINQ